MKMLVKTLAAAVVGTVLATSALAQNATNPGRIEHHVAKIDGTRFHYVPAIGENFRRFRCPMASSCARTPHLLKNNMLRGSSSIVGLAALLNSDHPK